MCPLYVQHVEAFEVSAEGRSTWQPEWFKEWNFEVCAERVSVSGPRRFAWKCMLRDSIRVESFSLARYVNILGRYVKTLCSSAKFFAIPLRECARYLLSQHSAAGRYTKRMLWCLWDRNWTVSKNWDGCKFSNFVSSIFVIPQVQCINLRLITAFVRKSATKNEHLRTRQGSFS
jgi:hypothetical protein